MGLSGTERRKCGYRADFSVHDSASVSGAAGGAAQRYAERVEAWEDEGGALPGGAAVGGRPAKAVTMDAARG